MIISGPTTENIPRFWPVGGAAGAGGSPDDVSLLRLLLLNIDRIPAVD
jgi:hypothetical protein